MLLLRSHVMARLYDAIGISAFACKLLITLATLVVLGSRHHSPSKINLSVPAVGARSHMITHLMKEVLFLLLCTHFIFFFSHYNLCLLACWKMQCFRTEHSSQVHDIILILAPTFSLTHVLHFFFSR
jgi:hypothetical protein